MARSHRLAALVLSLLLVSPAIAAASDWTVGEESRVGFRTSQAGQAVEGQFKSFEASIRFDPSDLGDARVEVTIEIASVDSGSADRDSAIRSPSLFDAETWPTARFVAEQFEIMDDEAYEASGQLTLRDVTREVTLPFTLAIEPDSGDPARKTARATGEIEILRLDYGIGQGLFKDTSMVPDAVTILIDIAAQRPAE